MSPTDGNSGIGVGIVEGRLAPCPHKPNCVSSQAAARDQQHYIEGLTYSGEPGQARERLEGAIAGMKRAQVVVRAANYWRAEFRTRCGASWTTWSSCSTTTPEESTSVRPRGWATAILG